MEIYDKNYQEIISDPLFTVVAEKAKVKGFRIATGGDVRASANFTRGAPDLYSAYGVNWVKDE